MSDLKIVCKRKSSRQLRKNIHITIQRRNYFQSISTNVIMVPKNKRHRRTDRRSIYCGITVQ